MKELCFIHIPTRPKQMCHMKELCFIYIITRPKQMCDMKEMCDVNEGAVSYE